MADELVTWTPRRGTNDDDKYLLNPCLMIDRATVYGGELDYATTGFLNLNEYSGYAHYFMKPELSTVNKTIRARGYGTLVVDGKTVSQGDTVLVMHGPDYTANGPYECTDAGGVSSKWVLTRISGRDANDEFPKGLYFKIKDGDANAGKYFILWTWPKGNENFGFRDSSGNIKLYKTRLFFFETFEKFLGGVGNARGISQEPWEAGLLVRDHATLSDMEYIQTDTDKITVDHVNEIRGMNQLIAEVNRRIQLMRLTGNILYPAYLQYMSPFDRHDVDPPVDPGNLIGQRIKYDGSIDTVEGGRFFTGYAAFSGDLQSIVKDVSEKEGLITLSPIDDFGLVSPAPWWNSQSIIQVTPREQNLVSHDWIEVCRKQLSKVYGDCWVMHNSNTRVIERYYTKQTDPTQDWDLYGTYNSTSSDEAPFDLSMEIGISVQQPSYYYYGYPYYKKYYYEGELVRRRMYFQTKIDTDILPPWDDIDSAKLRFKYGYGEWVTKSSPLYYGLDAAYIHLEIWLSDSDAATPTWAMSLDHLVDTIDIAMYLPYYGTEWKYYVNGEVQDVTIPAGILTKIKNRIKDGNNYCNFVFVLNEERLIPDGFGGTIAEPDNQSYPEDYPYPSYYGAQDYKWATIKGVNLRLYTS